MTAETNQGATENTAPVMIKLSDLQRGLKETVKIQLENGVFFNVRKQLSSKEQVQVFTKMSINNQGQFVINDTTISGFLEVMRMITTGSNIVGDDGKPVMITKDVLNVIQFTDIATVLKNAPCLKGTDNTEKKDNGGN